MRIFELNNADNWESIYNTEVNAVQVPLENGGFLQNPIGAILVPFLIEKFVIAINVNTDVPELSVWRFAGYVNQRISTGLQLGGSQDATVVKTQPLFLNQINLVIFEKISSAYSVTIQVPRWFPRAAISVWQYVGVDDTSQEILMTQEFANINFKLDLLLNS